MKTSLNLNEIEHLDAVRIHAYVYMYVYQIKECLCIVCYKLMKIVL